MSELYSLNKEDKMGESPTTADGAELMLAFVDEEQAPMLGVTLDHKLYVREDLAADHEELADRLVNSFAVLMNDYTGALARLGDAVIDATGEGAYPSPLTLKGLRVVALMARGRDEEAIQCALEYDEMVRAQALARAALQETMEEDIPDGTGN